MLNSLFLHPGFLIAGGILISLPILIHLINRMRFKRIRWAAMEFLLKSQKRNRRRLIIEQLLLLALRCLLVALTGFLVARYVGNILGKQFGAQTTDNIVVLDDTLSMGDHEFENGIGDHTAFEKAREQILKIANTASQANAAQQFRVLLLSDLAQPLFDRRLGPDTLAELKSKLDEVKPSFVHVKPLAGFKIAAEYVNRSVEGQKAVHFVSDFRESDWNGTDQDLTREIDTLLARGVSIYLVDAAFPLRKDNNPVAPEHPNVALLDLQADTRVAALDGRPVEFTATIANNSPGEITGVEFTVAVDSRKDEGASMVIKLPPGITKHKFEVGLYSKEGFRHVSAYLGRVDDGVGLKADNIRHALVKVEKNVRVLLVDGSFPDHLRDAGDAVPVQNALAATRGYKVDIKSIDELDKGTLNQYPCIYLLNVPTIKSPKGLKNLEDYVAAGGRIVFFMGDRVDPEAYNKLLYKQGEGLLPAPLDRRTEKLTDEERLEMQFNNLYKLYLRTQSQEHQKIVEGLSSVREALRWLMIDQYLAAQPRAKWIFKPGEVEELATLPSRRSLEFYRASTQEMLKKLPLDDSKYEKYRTTLVRFTQMIKQTLTGTFVYKLADDLDQLLHYPGDPKDPAKPSLLEFWGQAEMQGLKSEVEQLHDAVQYGDPFIIVKKYGKGRTVAVMTSAGRSWNEWSGGCLASFTFPMFISDLQKYLTAPNESQTYVVGAPATDLEFDANRYKPEAERLYTNGYPRDERGHRPRDAEALGGDTDDTTKVLGVAEKNVLTFAFGDARRPGFYLFTLHPKGEGVKDNEIEERAYVFNIDATAESDLRRAIKDKLEKNTSSKDASVGKMMLIAPDSSLEVFRQRQSDLSESPWLYLVFLAMLIGEQALAVHLSFHLRGGEAELPRQVLRSQGTAA